MKKPGVSHVALVVNVLTKGLNTAFGFVVSMQCLVDGSKLVTR